MKIRLIQPAQLDDSGKPIKYKKILLPSGTLSTIAALTPNDVEVSITNEYIDTIDFSEDLDIVGITALTCHAPRAYQIAQEFKKRGKTVVMGGIHATALPQEALQHVDSVVVGEAENLWEKVVRDFQKNNKLNSIYKNDVFPDLKKLVIPRFDLNNSDKCLKAPFAKTPAMPIFTTRGCPFSCSYCSVTKFFGGKYRTKPIDNVLREIDASKARDFFFVDDNLAANSKYSEQLFKEITPLKIRWFSQFSTRVLNNPKLVELAGESGCHEVILGIESLNICNLKSVNKSFNKPEEYARLFKLLKSNGISPHVMIMFGLENDDVELLKRTLEFLLDNDVNFIRIFTVTPYPGTDLYQKLDCEGRIFEKDWSKYDLNHIVFSPKNISIQDLQDNVWKSYYTFYSYKNIIKRLWKFKKFYLTPDKKGSLLDDLLFQLHFHIATGKRLDPWSGVN
ncbi:MAG: radical SAM protein [Spirochaetota bacterium]|nr:radical SAM protein [Spirochaetota bacterium]